ncbi:hypothetical protein VPHK394_0049 [Vibrio phage K394]
MSKKTHPFNITTQRNIMRRNNNGLTMPTHQDFRNTHARHIIEERNEMKRIEQEHSL